jgi:hypothetical protein
MEWAEAFCARIAGGEIPTRICKEEGMPTLGCVRKWRAQHPEFDALYARSYDLLCEYWGEEIITIGDDATNDYMERELRNAKGELIGRLRVVDHENINRSRLRCDNRKWLLSKLARHKYGDKLDVNVSQPAKPPDLGIDWDDGGPGTATAARLSEGREDEPSDEE